MTKGIKLSDPIINYPSLRDYSYEEIDAWLEDNKEDNYLIKFYCRYINKTITEYLTRLDDNNASIIRRGFKLLEKWDTEYSFPQFKKWRHRKRLLLNGFLEHILSIQFLQIYWF